VRLPGDRLKGGALVILTLSLIVFAAQVPALVGFTVARLDDTSADPADASLA
jgi:hypothetical protein